MGTVGSHREPLKPIRGHLGAFVTIYVHIVRLVAVLSYLGLMIAVGAI